MGQVLTVPVEGLGGEGLPLASLPEGVARNHERAKGAVAKTRKSAATRQRIMTAASQIMMERGNTSFQMSEVSARCNMSKGALYYYFSDRDELTSAVFAEVIDETVSAIEDVMGRADTARGALRDLCHEVVQRLKGGSPLALAVTYEFSSSTKDVMPFVSDRFARIIKVISTQIEKAKGEGVVRPDVDPILASVFVVGGFVMTSLAAVNRGIFSDSDDLEERLLELSVRGFGFAA